LKENKERKMTKQSINNILKHLDDFPENKISSLINYIEFLKQRDTINITRKREENFSNINKGIEAGP